MESLVNNTRLEPPRSIIKGLLKSGAALLAGCKTREVFQSILAGIVDLGFRRVRLYLISKDQQTLRCVAAVGMQNDFEGTEWSTSGDEPTQLLYSDPRPHTFKVSPTHPDQHARRLGRESDDQWIEAPLVLEGRVVGKVCADNEHGPLPASLDLDLLHLFAQQAAVALEKSRLLEEAHERLSMFERMREIARTLEGDFDPPALLELIIKNAVILLNAKNGGIYEYVEEQDLLRVVAELNRKDLLGRTMPKGKGMAGRLVLGNEAYMIEDNYAKWPDHDPSCTFFGAVLEVPMRLRGRIAGVIYVDDEVGRKFTEQDAERLTMFTGHAAAALETAELSRKRKERLVRLERLAEAMAEITADPERPFKERLNLIAKRVATILDADNCEIHLVQSEGVLSVTANDPDGRGPSDVDKTRNAPNEALLRYAASTRTPFRAHGTQLAGHSWFKDEKPHVQCHSVLVQSLLLGSPGTELEFAL